MKVVISGGVHGNELIGVYLVKELQKRPPRVPGLEIDFLLGNPKAIKECRRYVDKDLNRSFGTEALKTDSHIYEYERAKVIAQRLQGCDFLIDLHTTTANMGITLVLESEDELSTAVAGMVTKKFGGVRVLRWFQNDEGPFINSLAPHSITIEVGPVCQGVLDPYLYFRLKDLIFFILEQFQRNPALHEKPKCYDIVASMDFPRDKSGDLAAMVHPHLLGRDYDMVAREDPLFITFEGEVIFYEGEPLYAVFINEAAYYEKNIAFFLCKKSTL
jgi:aspartoacylase